MITDFQIDKRLQLEKIRDDLIKVICELESLKQQETKLIQEINPQKERCQRCLGTGKEITPDYQHRYEAEQKCHACNGTGIWKEPI